MLCRIGMFLAGVLASVAAASRGADLSTLRVLSDAYPRAYFFRYAESLAAHPRVSYEQWEACVGRLMGIEGKVLDEEVPGRSVRNIDFFTRFKARHPEQLVLLHYNGDGRDPRDHIERFFAGHWLYYPGAIIGADVPAADGETEIRIGRPELFLTAIGRYGNSNDDVGLCDLDAQGRPNWSRSEQVQIVSVDAKQKRIRVRRACYGSGARAFAAGRAYAAAHVTEGPWGAKSHLLWCYNYATCCPRDARGRTCADVLSDELAERFAPRGALAAFDGLEFDVLNNQPMGGGQRLADADADGRPDRGWVGGLNSYGIGVVEFCRLLRRKMGPAKLILADGMSVVNQRAAGIINGIESEGWPILNDWEIRDWSGGLNRHFFWSQNAAPPVLNYINHKFVTPGPERGREIQPEVPSAVHRLVMAAAMFTDSAVCYSFVPPKPPGELLGIWDELQKGSERQPGWLGRPLGPAVRLAERDGDMLCGLRGAQLLGRLRGRDVRLAVDGDRVRVTTCDPKATRLRLRLIDVPCRGPDLLVTTTLRGDSMRGYPREMPRLAWLGITDPGEQLTEAEMPATGMAVRGRAETALATESGAAVRWLPRADLGGQTHAAYLVHPPYRGGVGYTFWQRDTEVSRGAELVLFTGMGERSPGRSDGVTFRIMIAELHGGTPGTYRRLMEHSQVASQWIEHRVPLAEWAGKRVRLKFVSDCGPKDNAVADHSYWGDVATLVSDPANPASRPEQFMTWVNDRPLASRFAFSSVVSKSVQLEWTVEGSEPIWISTVAVHPGADAIYREFQHGLVLANPSPRPYQFDLGRLVPGGKFRRLRGSAEQDPVTNNGAAVEGPITLGPKEGLFLVRQ